jgi:hypothetical protein
MTGYDLVALRAADKCREVFVDPDDMTCGLLG